MNTSFSFWSFIYKFFESKMLQKAYLFTKIGNWNSNIYWKETKNVQHHVFLSEIYLFCIAWPHEATSSLWFSFNSILRTFIVDKFVFVFSIKYKFEFVYGMLCCIVVIRMLYTKQQSLTSNAIMLYAIQNALNNYIKFYQEFKDIFYL